MAVRCVRCADIQHCRCARRFLVVRLFTSCIIPITELSCFREIGYLEGKAAYLAVLDS